MTEIIAIDGLTKSFGRHRALAGLDLAVRAGEVHGFLGPNGAGKSTTINVLMGLLKPDSGTVRLLGGDPRADAVELHRRVAHVPGDVELWPSLTGGEIIDLLGRMRGGQSPARRAELVERFDLDTGKKAKTYSTGNRQKVVLVAAFASDAEVLILDEPTSGLDPLMEIVFQEEVERARAEGRTVLLSSHILAEVERLADRVTIVRNGVTVETGSLAELRHLTGTSVEAVTNTPADGVATWPGVSDVVQNGLDVRFQVAADGLDAAVAGLGRFGIRALTCAPPSLEELMLRHYDGPAGGE